MTSTIGDDDETWAEMRGHEFFSGAPGPPGTEHLWGWNDYEDTFDDPTGGSL